jgi:hypothetical protein
VLGGQGIPPAGTVPDLKPSPPAERPDHHWGDGPTGDEPPATEPGSDQNRQSPPGTDNEPSEPPASEPEPPVEPPPPAEPPAEEPQRPPPVDEQPAVPEPGNGDTPQNPGDGTTQPPAQQPGNPGNPNDSTALTESARPGSPAARTVRFARATGLPVSSIGALSGPLGATAAGAAVPAPAADAGGFGRVGADASGDDGQAKAKGNGDGAGADAAPEAVVRTVRDIVEVVPSWLKFALGGLAALCALLFGGYLFSTLRARRLDRQRRELLQEVGLLQSALLPPVPERLGALRTSVAYRPADGPGAGGDFYDAVPLSGGRVGFILGDVSGHGRGALARTAFMRYTLRAYLEAGLEPRVALQVAGRVIDENLGGDFATVLLAVHDPETGSLTYATAGHPAPIVVGPQPHDPVTASSSPPIGVGERTGLRQTTVPLVPGSVACLFTDGLIEARKRDGVLGRERLTELLEELGPDASARDLIARAAKEARVSADDIAALIISPTAGVTTGLFRTEQLELSARELDGPLARRFLESCELPASEVDAAEAEARTLADRFGGVVLHVVFGNRRQVEVLPRNVESIEAASRRSAAAR